MLSTNRMMRLAFPVVMLAICGFLWLRIAQNASALDVPSAVGPAGWPRAMIVGLAIFSLLNFISELLQWRSAVRMGQPDLPPQSGDDAGENQTLALIGVGIIILYGYAIPLLGFAFATIAFTAIWCLLGRVRHPLTVILVSLIGTVVLLYMFVALAKMPLNRGVEPFGSWTVAIYRLLHIY